MKSPFRGSGFRDIVYLYCVDAKKEVEILKGNFSARLDRSTFGILRRSVSKIDSSLTTIRTNVNSKQDSFSN